jgi:hypothetical protein
VPCSNQLSYVAMEEGRTPEAFKEN